MKHIFLSITFILQMFLNANLVFANEESATPIVVSSQVVHVWSCSVVDQKDKYSFKGLGTISNCEVRVALPIEYCEENYSVFDKNEFKFNTKYQYFKGTETALGVCEDDHFQTAKEDALTQCENEKKRLQEISIYHKNSGCNK